QDKELLQSEINIMKTKVDTLDQELGSLKAREAEVNLLNKSMENDICSLRADKSELQNKFNLVQEENKNLQRQLQATKENGTSIEDNMKNTIINLQTSLGKLEHTILMHQKQTQLLENQIGRLEQEKNNIIESN